MLVVLAESKTCQQCRGSTLRISTSNCCTSPKRPVASSRSLRAARSSAVSSPFDAASMPSASAIVAVSSFSSRSSFSRQTSALRTDSMAVVSSPSTSCSTRRTVMCDGIGTSRIAIALRRVDLPTPLRPVWRKGRVLVHVLPAMSLRRSGTHR
jgi:hypothetical protein